MDRWEREALDRHIGRTDYCEYDLPSEKQLEDWREANEYIHEGDDETVSHGPYADYTDLDWANEAENDRLQVHLEEQRRELGDDD